MFVVECRRGVVVVHEVGSCVNREVVLRIEGSLAGRC